MINSRDPGQAQDITHRFGRSERVRSVPKQNTGRIDLHADDAHAPSHRLGEYRLRK